MALTRTMQAVCLLALACGMLAGCKKDGGVKASVQFSATSNGNIVVNFANACVENIKQLIFNNKNEPLLGAFFGIVAVISFFQVLSKINH